MTEQTRRVFEEALSLSAQERAEIACELWASLETEDAFPEGNPNPAWTAELERRAREALADTEGGVSWETARADILAELRSRRG